MLAALLRSVVNNLRGSRPVGARNGRVDADRSDPERRARTAGRRAALVHRPPMRQGCRAAARAHRSARRQRVRQSARSAARLPPEAAARRRHADRHRGRGREVRAAVRAAGEGAWRRHGRDLSGAGHAAAARRGAEVPARRPQRRPAGQVTISARSARRRGARPPKRLHDSRDWRNRATVSCSSPCRSMRARPSPIAWRAVRCRSSRPSASPDRSRRALRMRTIAASSIATSSRPT